LAENNQPICGKELEELLSAQTETILNRVGREIWKKGALPLFFNRSI